MTGNLFSLRRGKLLALVVCLAAVLFYLSSRVDETAGPGVKSRDTPGTETAGAYDSSTTTSQSAIIENDDKTDVAVIREDVASDIAVEPMPELDAAFKAFVEELSIDFIDGSEGLLAVSVEEEKTPEEVAVEAIKELFERGASATTLVREAGKLIQEAGEKEREAIRAWLMNHYKGARDETIRSYCLSSIAHFRDEEACEFIIYALDRDQSRYVKTVAASRLGRYGDVGNVYRAIDSLRKAAHEDKGVVGHGRKIAENVVWSLGQIGTQDARDALYDIWQNSADSWHLSNLLLITLANTDDPRALPLLEDALVDDHPYRRGVALSGFRIVACNRREKGQDYSEMLELIRDSLYDPVSGVRQKASKALGYIGDESDIRLIEPFLKDEYSRELNYSRGGEEFTRTAYPLREAAQEAIDAIQKRLAEVKY